MSRRLELLPVARARVEVEEAHGGVVHRPGHRLGDLAEVLRRADRGPRRGAERRRAAALRAERLQGAHDEDLARARGRLRRHEDVLQEVAVLRAEAHERQNAHHTIVVLRIKPALALARLEQEDRREVNLGPAPGGEPRRGHLLHRSLDRRIASCRRRILAHLHPLAPRVAASARVCSGLQTGSPSATAHPKPAR